MEHKNLLLVLWNSSFGCKQNAGMMLKLAEVFHSSGAAEKRCVICFNTRVKIPSEIL